MDLTIIPYTIHWCILIILCRKPLHWLLGFTFGIYFTCFLYVFTPDSNKDTYDDWMWFDYVKRISLFILYLAYVFIYNTNGSKSASIFMQWALCFNVFEAAGLALQYGEVIVGLLLVFFAPFVPQIFIDPDNKTLYGVKGNITQKEKFDFVSVKWYFRGYLVVLGCWGLTNIYFTKWDFNIYFLWSCLFSFLLNEYFLNNFWNHFNIRIFSLIIGTPILTTQMDRQWLFKEHGRIIPMDMNIILRNFIQLVMILVVFGLCYLNDEYRSKQQPPPDSEVLDKDEDSDVIGQDEPVLGVDEQV